MSELTFVLPADDHDALAFLCEVRDALDERAAKVRKFNTAAWDAKAQALETAALIAHGQVLTILSRMARGVIKGN